MRAWLVGRRGRQGILHYERLALRSSAGGGGVSVWCTRRLDENGDGTLTLIRVGWFT